MSSSSLFFPRGPLPCDYLPEASLIVSPTQTPQFRQTQEFPYSFTLKRFLYNADLLQENLRAYSNYRFGNQRLGPDLNTTLSTGVTWANYVTSLDLSWVFFPKE